jgi:MFS family permease
MHELKTNAAYRTLLAAGAIDGIGNSLYNIVFIIYAATMPFKALAVSLASMAGLLPALFAILTGYWADHTRSKSRGLVRAYLLQTGLFLVLAGLIGQRGNLFLFCLLLLINIVSDICGGYANGLNLPILKATVPVSELNSALSLNTASATTIQLVFGAVGASLIVLLQHNYGLFGLLNAASFALAAVIVFTMRRHLRVADKPAVANSERRAVKGESFFKSAAQTLKYLRHNHFIIAVMSVAVFINILGTSVDGLMSVSLLSMHQLWFGDYGYTVAIMNALFGIGMVAGALFANDGLQKVPVLALSVGIAVSMGVLGLAFIYGQSRLLIAVAILFSTYLTAKVNPRISAVLMSGIDSDHLAQAQGVLGLVALIAAPLGQAIFLTLINAFGAPLAWTTFAVSSFVLVLGIWFLARRVHEPQLVDEK